MPRLARIVVPGAPHHITQRGNNRQDVFFVDDDRKVYLGFLREYAARYRNNDIDRQLDLLFEYAQWFVARFGLPGRTFARLWRGVNGFAEHSLVEGSLRDRHCVLRLNNLVSFSLSRERAEEFGDWILEVDVPTTKLLFFQGLLPGSPLAAEGEALVIGGDYHARASYL